MANSISLITKYLPLYEESLALGELTGDIVNQDKLDFAGAKKVKVFKASVGTAKSYNRAAGYSKNDVTAGWQEMTMDQDRYIKLGIDSMDNEETQDLTNKLVLIEAAKQEKKEIDMYRFGAIATTNNITTATAAALSNGAAVASALDVAEAAIVDAEASIDNCILYITPTLYTKLKRELGDKSGRFTLGTGSYDNRIEYFDGMKVVQVPEARFYVGTQYNETTEAIEALVTNNTTQKINFLIVNKDAVACPVKLYKEKFIPEDINADAREDILVLNWYHDAFVFDTMAASIYLHPAVAA